MTENVCSKENKKKKSRFASSCSFCCYNAFWCRSSFMYQFNTQPSDMLYFLVFIQSKEPKTRTYRKQEPCPFRNNKEQYMTLSCKLQLMEMCISFADLEHLPCPTALCCSPAHTGAHAHIFREYIYKIFNWLWCQYKIQLNGSRRNWLGLEKTMSVGSHQLRWGTSEQVNHRSTHWINRYPVC